MNAIPIVPVRVLDAQTGTLTSGKMKAGQQRNRSKGEGGYHGDFPDTASAAGTYGDSGGASRFFYCGKATKKERGPGNDHPTVKPLDLMGYLLTLLSTPTGGVILDPFAGSGTTLVAAKKLGRPCIGVELDAHNCDIAVARLESSTPMSYTREQIAAALDLAVLKPTATTGDVIAAARLVKEEGIASICVAPCNVRLAKQYTDRVCAVIGFPHGNTTPEVKQYEARQAIDNGAVELDVVCNYGRFLDGTCSMATAGPWHWRCSQPRPREGRPGQGDPRAYCLDESQIMQLCECASARGWTS